MPDLAPIQLYNLTEDPQELNNVQDVHPEKIAKLKELLVQYIVNGRSTQGAIQQNDGPELWPELNWMDR